MKRTFLVLGTSALILAAAIACGDSNTNTTSTGAGGASVAGQAGSAGQNGGAAGATGGSAGQDGGAAGATGGNAGQNGGAAGATGGSAGQNSGTTCPKLSIDLHQGSPWYISLTDMNVTTTKPAAWDFTFAKSGQGPWIKLADGVEAQDLGNTTPFDQVTQAPADGYQSDPDLIGNSWQDGGSGETTGFHMSENVYVLHLHDGNYAKLTVLSAKTGKIEMAAFAQTDGSRNLDCSQ